MIYYLKRIISAIFTLFIIATLTFFMMRAIPGGPFTRERTLDPVIEARLLAQYNLDAPLMEQYFDYMNDLIHFDLGPSFQYKGYTVNDFIRVGFPISAKIGAIATLAVIIVGIPIGIISALKQNKPIDYTVMVLATLGVTIPSFIIATLYIYIFGYKLNWVPAGGMGDSPLYYTGPVIAYLAIPYHLSPD